MRFEFDGIGINGEFGGIENNKLCIGDNIDGDVNGAGEFALGEVRFEL